MTSGRKFLILTVVALAVILAAAPACPALAADPQSYSVKFDDTGTAALDRALRDASLLRSLRSSAPVSPLGLIERARADEDRLDSVLQGFGYYLGSTRISIAGRRPDDPELASLLENLPAGQETNVDIQAQLGPLYHLRRVTLDGSIPPEIAGALMLMSGAPAIAADVLAARERLLNALPEHGFPLAQVSAPRAVADDTEHVLDITFTVQPGPPAVLGAISFTGAKSVNEMFLRRIAGVKTGDPYRQSALESARRALMDTGVFSDVVVRPGATVSPDGQIPVEFTVEERPLHAVNISGSWSTDLGAMLSAGWSHRNLFGNAEQLNLLASGNDLWGNAVEGPGYQFTAQFIKPDFLTLHQSLEADLSALRQELIAYRQTSEGGLLRVTRTFVPRWTASAGLGFLTDDVDQESTARSYQLFSAPLTLAYDSTGLTQPLLDATHGLRASLAVTPSKALGFGNTMFFILQASASAYFDLSGDGRSVFAARALAGSILGASTFDVPPDQRFYAGGSTTVRGYRWQSIGPQFSDGNPTGGSVMDAGSLEFRQRIFADWALAAFVDAGQDSAGSVPFTGTVRAGLGGGVRYYTSFGAIRADVAMPLNPGPGADAFEIYVGLGQAF